MFLDVPHRRCPQLLFFDFPRSQTSFFSYLKPFYDLVLGPNETTHTIGWDLLRWRNEPIRFADSPALWPLSNKNSCFGYSGYELIRAITLSINGRFGPTEKRTRPAAHLWEFLCAIWIFKRQWRKGAALAEHWAYVIQPVNFVSVQYLESKLIEFYQIL